MKFNSAGLSGGLHNFASYLEFRSQFVVKYFLVNILSVGFNTILWPAQPGHKDSRGIYARVLHP